MREGSLFARLSLASRYEQSLMEIVAEAVQTLADNDPAENEPSLNRKLYRSIVSTCHKRRMRGEDAPDFAPAFDAPNPPLSLEFAPSENKRPDLRWDLIDHLSEPENVRSFAVECKRLRSKSATGWHFNRSYALHGVARFVELNHQYGANMASGAMVGYWQNMSLKAVLDEINAALRSIGLPALSFNGLPSGLLHQTDQILSRSFDFSPYRLRHLWLDMRSAEAMDEAEKAGAEAQSPPPEPATRLARSDMESKGHDGVGRDTTTS